FKIITCFWQALLSLVIKNTKKDFSLNSPKKIKSLKKKEFKTKGVQKKRNPLIKEAPLKQRKFKKKRV
ncbi:hypothetical protein ACR9LE_04420, partial [Helicobacter pylori]